MPIEVTHLDSGKGVLFEGKGTLAAGDIIGATEQILLRDLAAEPYLYALIDLSGIERTSVTGDDIRRIADQDVQVSRELPRVVVAVVTADDAVFGLARAWQAYVSVTNWDTWVFRDADEARRWIRSQVAEIFGERVELR